MKKRFRALNDIMREHWFEMRYKRRQPIIAIFLDMFSRTLNCLPYVIFGVFDEN